MQNSANIVLIRHTHFTHASKINKNIQKQFLLLITKEITFGIVVHPSTCAAPLSWAQRFFPFIQPHKQRHQK